MAVPGHQKVTAPGECRGNQDLISLSTPRVLEAEEDTRMDAGIDTCPKCLSTRIHMPPGQ